MAANPTQLVDHLNHLLMAQQHVARDAQLS